MEPVALQHGAVLAPHEVLDAELGAGCIAVARNYGIALGATRLRLAYPDLNLLRYYELLGFRVAWQGGKPVYCEQEI